MTALGYRCSRCGAWHDEPPMSYVFPAPLPWEGLTRRERKRSVLGEEQCVILDRDFFVKANIELPVRDAGEPFVWTVWGSLSRASFERASERWDDPDRVGEPPYFSWLSSSIPGYPETFGLKTHMHTRPVGERPVLELEPTDHPLAVEQREGITTARVRELAERILHHE